MAISAKQVNELRKLTGAGMMDCKKALTEAEGDVDGAVALLRKKGQKISAKRADRSASEGVVFTSTNDEATEGIVFSLNCETDFVAKNDEFVALGNKILDVAKANSPATAEELTALELEGGRSVQEIITDYMGKIGEKIEVSKYATVKAEKVVPYIHFGAKLGVLVALSGVADADVDGAGKDVGMQIAAMSPAAVDKDGVDADVVEAEKQLGIEKARQEGKPEHILEKIAMGYVAKYYKENTLLNQEFVKDPKQTVKQYLNGVQKGLTVTAFERVSIG